MRLIRKFGVVFFVSFCLTGLTVAIADRAERMEVFLSSIIQMQENDSKTMQRTFQLPNSLLIIEDNAFEGTAIRKVELPASVSSIGDYAFSKIPTLEIVEISGYATCFGNNVFKNSNQVTIICPPKSYAGLWAEKNRIPFIPVETIYVRPTHIIGISAGGNISHIYLGAIQTHEHETIKPTGFFIREKNTKKDKNIDIYYISGRSPPEDKMNNFSICVNLGGQDEKNHMFSYCNNIGTHLFSC